MSKRVMVKRCFMILQAALRLAKLLQPCRRVGRAAALRQINGTGKTKRHREAG